jgi:lysyl-tRNA synthetase class 1
MPSHSDLATHSTAWPFQEARLLAKRFEKAPPAKGYALFETGYGPSGLPHIGTFMEVFRTTLVRHAFEQISDIPTKLFCISDDMDGMRKVPENLPHQEMLRENLGKPLTQVPDPFGTHESYGHHMNARLRAFLDHYRFEYEFKSATDLYRDGTYDASLLLALKHYDALMAVMLPTLGEERQATYSPFLPISPKTGKVLYVPMKAMDVEKGTITFDDEDGETLTLPVTGGHCKLQWKPDFGMRWAALGVDYEMFGKDHQPSAPLYSRICEILGGTAPVQFVYEMFLDDKGQKISKSKGNGLTIDEWLRYAPPESMAYYMYQSPRKAKRLHFDVIPKHMDEYLSFLEKFTKEEPAKQLENPVWHIHSGTPPQVDVPISFGLLLNLACACNPESSEVLWGFIRRYAPNVTPETHPLLAAMVEHARVYYEDFIRPHKQYRTPTDTEKTSLEALLEALIALPAEADAESYQHTVFAVGKERGYENLRDWFQLLYETLLGQSQGPRMGSFIALYGRDETLGLIRLALETDA